MTEHDIVDRLDALIAIAERIAKALEGPTAEERLASEYARSKAELQRQKIALTGARYTATNAIGGPKTDRGVR